VEAAAGGGDKAELSLPAVSVEQAEQLRATLLGAAREKAEGAEGRPLYRATHAVLAVGGITSLSYLLAPAAVVGVVSNLLENLPGDLIERSVDQLVDVAPTNALGAAIAAGVAIVLVIVVAAAGSLLVDWDFTLADDGERLTASRGLLTRRVVVLERERIRGADVRDTPIRRPLRLAALTAIAAGLRGRSGGTTLAPVIRVEHGHELLRSVDPAAPDPAAPLVAHPPAARRRRLLRALAIPVVLLVAALALTEPLAIAAAVLVTALAVPLAIDRYRQLGHAFDGRRLAVREGSLRRQWSELDPRAAVAFDLRSSPGQRRAGVCTLTLHLGQGAGSRRALDLGEAQAAGLLEELDPALLRPLLAGRASA
jgi:putative membrane protein